VPCKQGTEKNVSVYTELTGGWRKFHNKGFCVYFYQNHQMKEMGGVCCLHAELSERTVPGGKPENKRQCRSLGVDG